MVSGRPSDMIRNIFRVPVPACVPVCWGEERESLPAKWARFRMGGIMQSQPLFFPVRECNFAPAGMQHHLARGAPRRRLHPREDFSQRAPERARDETPDFITSHLTLICELPGVAIASQSRLSGAETASRKRSIGARSGHFVAW